MTVFIGKMKCVALPVRRLLPICGKKHMINEAYDLVYFDG